MQLTNHSHVLRVFFSDSGVWFFFPAESGAQRNVGLYGRVVLAGREWRSPKPGQHHAQPVARLRRITTPYVNERKQRGTR